MGQGTPGEQGPQGNKGDKGEKGPRGKTGPDGTKGPSLTTINYTTLVNQLMTNQNSLNKISSELLSNSDKLPNIFANFIANDTASKDSINATISQNASYIKSVAKSLATDYTNDLRGTSGPTIDVIDYNKMSNDIITNPKQLKMLSTVFTISDKVSGTNPVISNIINNITDKNNQQFQRLLNDSLANSDIMVNLVANALGNNTTTGQKLIGDTGPTGNLGNYYNIKEALFTNTLIGAQKPATLWCADGNRCQTPDGMNGIIINPSGQSNMGSSLFGSNDNLEFKSPGNIEFKSPSTINIKNNLNINQGGSLNTRSVNFGGTNVGIYTNNNDLNFYSTRPNATITKDGVLNIPNGQLHLNANIGRDEGRIAIARGQNDQLEIWFKDTPILVVTTDGDIIFNGEIRTNSIDFPKYSINDSRKNNTNALGFNAMVPNLLAYDPVQFAKDPKNYVIPKKPFSFIFLTDGGQSDAPNEVFTIKRDIGEDFKTQRWRYRNDGQYGKHIIITMIIMIKALLFSRGLVH